MSSSVDTRLRDYQSMSFSHYCLLFGDKTDSFIGEALLSRFRLVKSLYVCTCTMHFPPWYLLLIDRQSQAATFYWKLIDIQHKCQDKKDGLPPTPLDQKTKFHKPSGYYHPPSLAPGWLLSLLAELIILGVSSPALWCKDDNGRTDSSSIDFLR